MSKEREEALRQLKKSEEASKDTFDSWVEDLEEAEQPDACNIHDEDCEACGS
jgi:hypothetical protein|tara:strand:+ start:848 stop:1003 length:156 start_codon:yes stop_codon:yes gene_type:complete